MAETNCNLIDYRVDWSREEIRGYVKEALGPASRDGMAYRWGIAASTGHACSDGMRFLSYHACGLKPPKTLREFDLTAYLREWQDRMVSVASMQPSDAVLAVTLAASLPSIQDTLDESDLCAITESLVEIHQQIIERSDVSCPLHLILGAELGWSLHSLSGIENHGSEEASKFSVAARRCLADWSHHESDSIARAVRGARDVRVILASLVRCKKLGILRGSEPTTDQQWRSVGCELSRWVIALTRHRGAMALSPAAVSMVKDDVAADGLLDQAVNFDRENLSNAKLAALGKAPKQVNLAWEVSLPEAMLHERKSKLAVMMPSWRVRSGRMHVDYHGEQVRLELFNGKQPMLSGMVEASIQVDGEMCSPDGPWKEVCEYSDDDVHYLEIEQDWTSGAMLQRQYLLLREDRCVLLSDAIIPRLGQGDLGQLSYQSRLPATGLTSFTADQRLRELSITTGKRKALCLPLAAPEWRVSPTLNDLQTASDGHLILTSAGKGRLYAPLWFDFAQGRLSRKRTWRQLTVADQLRIVKHAEAVGFRIQMGSEQWMIYRSLQDQKTRTVLGKHLIADFYCARFDPGDGAYEELITVDDSE